MYKRGPGHGRLRRGRPRVRYRFVGVTHGPTSTVSLCRGYTWPQARAVWAKEFHAPPLQHLRAAAPLALAAVLVLGTVPPPSGPKSRTSTMRQCLFYPLDPFRTFYYPPDAPGIFCALSHSWASSSYLAALHLPNASMPTRDAVPASLHCLALLARRFHTQLITSTGAHHPLNTSCTKALTNGRTSSARMCPG